MPSLSKYDPRMALRLFKSLTGQRGMNNASVEATNDGLNASSDSGTSTTLNDTSVNESDVVISHEAPPVNNDPWLRRFWKRKGNTKLRRLLRMLRRAWRFVMKFRDRSLSRDEHLWRLTHLREWNANDLDDYRRQRDADQLNKFHADQAKILKPVIVETLVRLKFCTYQIRGEREYIKQRPRINRVDVSPYAYTFFVSKIPFGVKAVDMVDDAVATELSVSVRKKVRAELDPVNGLRYTVMIASTLSVPNFVSFDDIKSMPKNLPPLGIFVGLGPNGKPVYRDLADAPHLLIGGGSGNGKSNAENMIACTLIRRNTPESLRLVFFDLKGGVEFGMYDHIPFLFEKQVDSKAHCDGIIEFPDQALSAFEALLVECNERLAKLKKAKVRNIAEFNRGKHGRNRIPYLVVFIDEWATTKRLAGDRVEKVLEVIANLSRATGIHFILASQNPKAEIINTAITVNFLWRLAFGMSTAASQAVLGNWNAFGLTPKGRCIFLSNDGEVEVQTPRITNSTITATLHAARTGEQAVQTMAVDVEEILDWALENMRGKLAREAVFEKFKDRITDAELRDLLKSLDHRTFEVRGTLYVIRPGSGNNSRWMERVDESSPQQPASDTENPVTRDEDVTEKENS